MALNTSRLIPENRPHTGWRVYSSMGIADGVIQMADIDRDREALVCRTEVASKLYYDPDKGIFIHRSGKLKGLQAGCLNQRGRRRIQVAGFKFLTSRLAWLLYYGEWPESTVDHINGDVADDRIVNLRLASESEQQWNRGIGKNNTSGVKGVSFNKRRARANLGPWESYITVYYKRVHLGFFTDREDAVEARLKAELVYHGEFAR